MGLLNRAETRNESKPGLFARIEAKTGVYSLDDMGKTLKEKITRLTVNENTAYTVLTLLKTYSAFQSGFCLKLRAGQYCAYTCLQTGVEGMCIPQEKLWSRDKAKLQYFNFEPGQDKNISYWIFPLDKEEPWKAILLLEAANDTFDPKPVAEILKGNTIKLQEFIIEEENTDPDIINDNLSGEIIDDSDLYNKINEFQNHHPEFACIVMEAGSDFNSELSSLLSNIGTSAPLSEGKSLILLPKKLDWELITNLISKVHNAKPLLSFEPEIGEDVLSRLQSFI